VEDGWKICQLLMIRTNWKVRISLAVELVNHPIPSLKAILALVRIENQKPGIPRSLRKNCQKRRVSPSRDLITRCSGWISLIQRFRTPDFRRFAPLGLPGNRLIGIPLGNHLFMPPPLPA
jgi:hypothetical protein